MSNSRRKTPICGITTARSEAWDKARWHRAFRRAQRVALHAGGDESLPERAFFNPWLMHKDGKQWFGSRWPALMRK